MRSAGRRAGAVLLANPALLVLAGGACAALPVLALLLGLRVETSVSHPAAAAAIATGAGATGALVGVTIGLAVPRSAGLGDQLAVAPVRFAALAFAGVVAPFAAAIAAVWAPVLLFAVTAAGGVGAGAAAGACASIVLGAAAATAARGVPAAPAAGAVVALAAVGVWVGAGVALGAAEAGPGAAAARAAAGGTAGSLLATVAAAGAGILLWSVACTLGWSRRPARRRTVRSRPLPHGERGAVVSAVVRVLTRHRELRLPALAAVLLPAVGAWAGSIALGVRGEAATAFAAGLALAAALVFPSAAHGVANEARWLLRASPQPPSATRRRAVSAGCLVALSIVVAAAVLAAPAGTPDPATAVELLSASALAVGAAAAAGAAVPWRACSIVQQVAAYAAAVVVAIAGWAVVARLLEPVSALGVGSTAFAVVAGQLALVGGVVAAGAAER